MSADAFITLSRQAGAPTSSMMAAAHARPALTVHVATKGEQFLPRLTYAHDGASERCAMYADQHDLTARVWRASTGRKWDVRACQVNAPKGVVHMGCELVLDAQTYEAASEGREVLESVMRAILEGK